MTSLQKIKPGDQWLYSGNDLVGIQNPRSKGSDLYGLTADQAAAVPAVPAITASDTSLAGATLNTLRINAALALGGTVTISRPGTYTVACTTVKTIGTTTYRVALLIPSNTKLVLGAGVIIKIRSGVDNACIIQNSDITGGNVNITIEGPGELNGNAAGSTRTDGNTFADICVWMQNITGLFLRGNLRIVDAHGWACGVAACTYVRTDGVYFDFTTSTANQGGFQFQGPNSDHIIRNTSGFTYDDLVAYVTDFQANAGLYNLTMAGQGPISNILVDGVIGDSVRGCYHHVRLCDSAANKMKNVMIRNLQGPYNKGGVFLGASNNTIQSWLENITIDGVQCFQNTATTTDALIHLTGNIDSLTVSNLQRRVALGETAQGIATAFGAQTTTVRQLTLKNITWIDDSTAGTNLVSIAGTGSNIGKLIVDNVNYICSVAGAACSMIVTAASGNFIDDLIVNNVQQDGGGRLLFNGGSITRRVKISNYLGRNLIRALIRHATASQTLPAVELANVSTEGAGFATDTASIMFSSAVSGTCRITCSNVSLAGGATVTLAAASGTISMDGLTQQGVEVAQLVGIVGDMIRDRATGTVKMCTTAPGTFTAVA